MKVIAPKLEKKQYEIPPEGPVRATLVEVQDKGLVSTGWGSKPKVLFVWDTELLTKDGEPIKVFERLTNTLHLQGRLSPRIRSLTGEIPDPEEDYDLSSLEGTKATLVIVHNVTEEGTYANIAAVIREMTAEEKAEEARVKKAVTALRQQASPVPVAEDQDIPF